MPLNTLKRPRFYVPVILCVLLAAASAVLFNPEFQKRQLLEYVGPLVDRLSVDHVQLTPWSLQFNRLDVDYRGGHFQVAQGKLDFHLLSLLWLELDISKLDLKDARIDLREFTPPESEPEPATLFPGVLASLAHGIGYALLEGTVNAELLLPGNQSVTAKLGATGIRPEGTGALNLLARFATGKGDDHFELDSRVYLTQLTRGRFRALESFHTVQAALASLPAPEQATLELAVKAADDEEAGAVNLPELLQLAVRQEDASGAPRSELRMQGRYDGNSGLFDGNYRFTANQRLVLPYVGDQPVPDAEQSLRGVLHMDLADLSGVMTITSNLLVSELRKAADDARLPERLRLENNLRVSLLPNHQLVVETLDSGLTDEAANTPLTTRLPQDLHVPLDDIEGFLHSEQTLLEFELPEVPLSWFAVLLPGRDITAGTLTGAFTITSDKQSVLHLKPLRALRIKGLSITQPDGSALPPIDLSVMPRASYSAQSVQLTLDRLDLAAGKETLVQGKLGVTVPLAADRAGSLEAHADTDLDMHHLASVLTGKRSRDQSLPRHLVFHADTRLRAHDSRLTFSELSASLATRKGTRLLDLQLQQPVTLQDSGKGMQLANRDGALATLALSDIQLGWFSAFVPDTTLRGRLYRASFTLSAESADVLRLQPDRPFRLSDVAVSGADGPLLESLGFSVLPELRLGPEGATLDYRELRLTGGKDTLASGQGALTVPSGEQPLLADGHLEADLQGLSHQPLLARVLQAALSAPARVVADYRLAQTADRVDISQLDAGLYYSDADARLQLHADTGIRIPTRLSRQRSALGGSRGKLTVAISNLTPEPFADILKARGIHFDSINASVVLDTNGRKVTIDSQQPLVISGLAVRNADAEQLRPFTLTAQVAATLQGERLKAKLADFSLRFARDSKTPTLQGRADVVLTGDGNSTRADSAQAELTLQLPGLLGQPALLPGHRLKAGTLNAFLRLQHDGTLSASAHVHDLKAAEELPLQSLLWQVDGRVDPDGSFNVTAPLTTTGKSGNSTLRMAAVHDVKTADNHDVSLALDSTVFYLNDILNTLQRIAGGKPAGDVKPADATAGETAATNAEDTAPDTRAAWDTTAYDVQATIRMDRLFYTDYLEFTGIQGRAVSLPQRLALNDFTAHFHDSAIAADGTIDFRGGNMPYDLKLKSTVDQFDLARFFRELAPGSTPRAEGLFDVRIDAFGQSPNLAQYRNNLYFDALLQSQHGTFRLLDPNSALVAGSTGIAGGVGEVTSYLPTGLFGLGVVSRLVDYIREVQYDKLVIQLVRDASRDVQIRQYVMQNPELLMTASGGITYQPGTDILQSPLSLDARLSLREKGAAIFYELNLLESEHDQWGYWLGPQITFRGTPANPQSNLDRIISKAGRGAVLGGLVRPISGLIGNIRHRWLDEKLERIEYPTEGISK